MQFYLTTLFYYNIRDKMLFLLLITTVLHLASAQTCKVQVEQGWLQGAQLELVTGDGQYCAFKGVPYAAPPVETKRFKATQPALPWNGVKNATEFGSVCPQIVGTEYFPGSEDCLFLNVYTMGLNDTSTTYKSPLPVMVFIHGDGFSSRSGDVYGPDFLIPNGVILVTINYRLDALGFLCLDSLDVPGNAGMKDQVEAFRWVQKNIAKFGGDPDNVTVFGYGEGAAFVGYHLYSPMSKGLFKRAILMAGCPINEWALSFFPTLRSFTLGRELGLDTDSAEEMLDFLQNQPVRNVVNKYPPVVAVDLMSRNNDENTVPYSAVAEKDFGQERFLTQPINELLALENDNPVDILTGITDFEGLLLFLAPVNATTDHYKAFQEYYVPVDLLLQRTPIESLNISNAIQDFYFGYHQSVTLPDTKLAEFLAYYSDRVVSTKVQFFIDDLIPQLYNAKRYFYRFSSVSERNYVGNKAAPYGFVGASHYDDLYYIFNINPSDLPAVDTSSETYKLIQQSCILWTNFAKYGNPTPDASLGIDWPVYDNVAKTFLDIGKNLTIGTQPNAKSLAFWRSLFNPDIVSSSPPTSPSTSTKATATATAYGAASSSSGSSRTIATSSSSTS